MLYARLITGLVFLLSCGGLAVPAEAYDQTTRWFSVRVQPASPASPPLFLTNTSSGVTLDRYRSGDPTQMWTFTQPDYPAWAAVTGDSYSDQGCFSAALPACEFLAKAGFTMRIVNRASGRCLSFDTQGLGGTIVAPAAKAVTALCAANGNAADRQKWTGYEHPAAIATILESWSGGNRACLTGADAGAATLAARCRSNNPSQLFFAQQSAEIACTTNSAYELCFAN